MKSEEWIREKLLLYKKLLDLNKNDSESIAYIRACGFYEALKEVLED